jgi:phage protein D
MPDLGTNPLLYPARPTLRIDGEVQPALSDALLGLSADETVDGVYRAEAKFGAWGTVEGEAGLLFTDRELLDFGRELRIEVGEGTGAARLFTGRIMALEALYPADGPPQLAILAEDALQELRMTRRSRVFEDQDDAAIFRTLAQDHGLTPEIDVDGPQHRAVAQLNLSDLAFLRERARRLDAELWIDDGTLHVQARTRRPDTPVELTYGQGLHELTVIADLAHQRTRVTVGGWDAATATAIEEGAGNDAIAVEAGLGLTGPALLEETLGVREECLAHLTVGSPEEARLAAAAQMRRLGRRFITGTAKAEGDARLRVGATVRLRGLGRLFDGDYYVCETHHALDTGRGFQTCFAIERTALGVG